MMILGPCPVQPFLIDANGTVPLGLGVKYEAEYLLGGATMPLRKTYTWNALGICGRTRSLRVEGAGK